MSTLVLDDTALLPTRAPSNRDVDTVPFVELFNGRVQGVVSAGSDPNRIYCAFVEAGTGNYYSSTNNNRPDAGTSNLWSCFPDSTHDLLDALSERSVLAVKDATLLPSGQLLWDGKAKAGKTVDFLTLAARLAVGAKDPPQMPLVDPLDRHPLQLAEPVFLDGFQVTTSDNPALDLGDGVTLPVARRRLGRASELQMQHITQAKALLGLLRFDSGRWEVQPLAVVLNNKKAEVVFTGSSAATSLGGKAAKTLATLKERASKLLRQKS